MRMNLISLSIVKNKRLEAATQITPMLNKFDKSAEERCIQPKKR